MSALTVVRIIVDLLLVLGAVAAWLAIVERTNTRRDRRHTGRAPTNRENA